MTEPSTPPTRANSMLARGVSRAEFGRTRALPGTPLYVHLPFCAAKCHYCDFFSVAAQGQDRGSMIAAILHEAELHAPRAPRTVFLGGGTPSLLSIDELRLLLDGLERVTGYRSSAGEVTAECNPESLDRDKARALLDLGVRRLSIGFQSLDDRVLGLFGRVHSVDDSFRAFEAARAAGIRELNIDLIYAVPGQTADAWRADLMRVLALGSEHLSAYNLTFEEDTLFRRWLEQGRIAKSPEDVELELFHVTREATRTAGLEAYEISNFARTGHACSHNLNYWRNGEYAGIGPSAVSKQGIARFGNVKAISAYTRRTYEEEGSLHWVEEADDRTRLAESWWLGLRLAEGLTALEARARARFEGDDSAALRTARELVDQGLLRVDDDRYRLTDRGLPLGDWVARRFLDVLS